MAINWIKMKEIYRVCYGYIFLGFFKLRCEKNINLMNRRLWLVTGGKCYHIRTQLISIIFAKLSQTAIN